MKTITDATLYIVNGPRGPYYAIRENETGLVFTERTERAAAAMANEKDLVIVERNEISHDQLLTMIALRCEPQPSAPVGDHPQTPVEEPAASEGHSSGLAGFARKVLGREPRTPVHR